MARNGSAIAPAKIGFSGYLAYALLDEAEFLSPHGIRSALPLPVSTRITFERRIRPTESALHCEDYEPPAEGDSGMFGGNSNWRGPDLVSDELCLFVNALERYLARLWRQIYKLEYPTGTPDSDASASLQIAEELIARRLVNHLSSPVSRRSPPGATAEKQRYAVRPTSWKDL